MKEQLRQEILRKMRTELSDEQLDKLEAVLDIILYSYKVDQDSHEVMIRDNSNERILQQFLSTKLVEGKSKRTISHYRLLIRIMLDFFGKSIKNISTNDLRYYLARYQQDRGVNNNTLDGMRRVFSSFFGWLSDEGYIRNNPCRTVKQIKVEKVIRKPFTDEEREKLRCACREERDLAIIEFLYSTGVRVSEMIGLNRENIRFLERETVVLGKGSKERVVYLNASACLHLKRYLETRADKNPALFVSEKAPNDRLTVAAVEAILRGLGQKAGIKKVHPHRYRRTAATNALNRGMPLQEVSIMLGHAKVETTMIYCAVEQESVKYNHKKYLSA